MSIAIFRGTGILSTLIKWRTWSEYSHAAWLHSDGSVTEAWAGGVRHVPSLSAQHTPGTVVDIFDVPDVNVDTVERFLEKQIGKGYDYWNILGFMLRKRVHDPKKWICSELVFAAVHAGGIGLLHSKSWKVSPGDLAMSPILKFVRKEVTK